MDHSGDGHDRFVEVETKAHPLHGESLFRLEDFLGVPMAAIVNRWMHSLSVRCGDNPTIHEQPWQPMQT
jgi:hypothetical protein